MVLEEEKQGGFIEIHHTHSEQVPATISSIIPDTACTIAGAESQMHSDRNIVHSIIWIVPEATIGDWKQPEPDFGQYESFDNGESETTNVGKPGQAKDDSKNSDSKSGSETTSKRSSSHKVKTRRLNRTTTSSPNLDFNPLRGALALVPLIGFLIVHRLVLSPMLHSMLAISPVAGPMIQVMNTIVPVMMGLGFLASVIMGFSGGSRY